MTSGDDLYQVVYFPHLGMTQDKELRFGRLVVWADSLLPTKVESGPLRERVETLLESHRAPSGEVDKARPLRGIGIVSAGPANFAALMPYRAEEIQELRCALFLACLSDNLTIHGPNAGHYMYTAENFSFIAQSFSLTKPYISETTGVLVTFTLMGYKIGEVQFPTPTYVPRPYPFRYDDELFLALHRLRRIDRQLYRRIMDASALFLESYYNTHTLDIRARILLQAAAFEVLLDLPASQQRKTFKDKIEQLCAGKAERRYRYKFEIHGQKQPESRTRKRIWADRFYTLRNHIIHGEKVRRSEFVFRGAQHHLLIAPIFFVHSLKRLIEDAFQAAGRQLRFYTLIEWFDGDQPDADDDDKQQLGFRCRKDLHAFFVEKLAAAGHL